MKDEKNSNFTKFTKFNFVLIGLFLLAAILDNGINNIVLKIVVLGLALRLLAYFAPKLNKWVNREW